MKLTDLISQSGGKISDVLHAELNPLANKFSLLRGLGHTVHTFHKAVVPWSCASTTDDKSSISVYGSSADCIIARSSSFYSAPYPLSALRIGNTFSFWRASSSTPVETVIGKYDREEPKPGTFIAESTEKTPESAFNRAFGGFSFPGTTPPPPVSHEKLVMDKLLDRYKIFINQKGLSTTDRLRVQQHVDTVHEIHRNISSPLPPVTSNSCTRPSVVNVDAKTRYKSYIDTIVAAMACGRTRVATLSLNAWNDSGSVSGSEHHSNTHGSGNPDNPYPDENRSHEERLRLATGWDGWLTTQFAYLLKKLDSVIEADGSTLLDNTIVVWLNEEGHASSHGSLEVPTIIAGGGSKRLRLGYYLDYRLRPFTSTTGSAKGWPISSMHRTIMAALGLAAAEFDKHGKDGFFGENGNYSNLVHANTEAWRKQYLPFLPVT